MALAGNTHRFLLAYGQSFLIIVDVHSKRPEVIETKSTTAKAIIKESCRLFATYGLPEHLVSDNGPLCRLC